jgi:hypothetical protein
MRDTYREELEERNQESEIYGRHGAFDVLCVPSPKLVTTSACHN